MSWISDAIGSTAGGFIESVGSTIRKFVTTDTDRQAFVSEMELLMQQRDAQIEQTIRAELGAKERILVAELQQDDKFTKRARPMVVYAGLGFIGFNYVLIPSVVQIIYAATGNSSDITPLADLPFEFWAAWGGICTTWVIGRSAEKRGVRNKAVQAITGSTLPTLLK